MGTRIEKGPNWEPAGKNLYTQRDNEVIKLAPGNSVMLSSPEGDLAIGSEYFSTTVAACGEIVFALQGEVVIGKKDDWAGNGQQKIYTLRDKNASLEHGEPGDTSHIVIKNIPLF